MHRQSIRAGNFDLVLCLINDTLPLLSVRIDAVDVLLDCAGQQLQEFRLLSRRHLFHGVGVLDYLPTKLALPSMFRAAMALLSCKTGDAFSP